MGRAEGVNLDKALQIAGELEDEELIRRMSLRKVRLVDANVLLYAVNRDEHHHSEARRWLEQPPAVVVEPTVRHLDVVGGLLAETGTAGNLVNDAHLAALALEHDATIVSFDSDFARFEGVRWTSPGA